MGKTIVKDYGLVLRLIGSGSGQAQACRNARMSHDTFERWRRQAPENESAYKVARSAGRAAMRLAIITLSDAPLAPGPLAKHERNARIQVIERRLRASYNHAGQRARFR